MLHVHLETKVNIVAKVHSITKHAPHISNISYGHSSNGPALTFLQISLVLINILLWNVGCVPQFSIPETTNTSKLFLRPVQVGTLILSLVRSICTPNSLKNLCHHFWHIVRSREPWGFLTNLQDHLYWGNVRDWIIYISSLYPSFANFIKWAPGITTAPLVVPVCVLSSFCFLWISVSGFDKCPLSFLKQLVSWYCGWLFERYFSFVFAAVLCRLMA